MPLAISWNKVLRRLCEHSSARHALTMFDENFIPFHPLTANDVSAALPDPASAVQVMVDGCESCARVCSDANATAGVVHGLGVDGISKRPNTAIT